MILTTQMLIEKYKDFADPKGKIGRDVKNGKLFKIAKGKYETTKNTSGSYLAGLIYGPSYLSFEYALSYYGLIPEAVYSFTSATFNKKKKKSYSNVFGSFYYQDVPDKAYPYGIIAKVENGYSYQIATAEKALCDKIYTISPVGSIKALKALLFEDLRIDEDEFEKLNKDDILKLAPLYNSTNLDLLTKFIKGENKR